MKQTHRVWSNFPPRSSNNRVNERCENNRLMIERTNDWESNHEQLIQIKSRTNDSNRNTNNRFKSNRERTIQIQIINKRFKSNQGQTIRIKSRTNDSNLISNTNDSSQITNEHCGLVVPNPAWNGTRCQIKSRTVSDIKSDVHWAYDCLGLFGILWVHMAWYKIVLKQHMNMNMKTGGHPHQHLFQRISDCEFDRPTSDWFLSRCSRSTYSWLLSRCVVCFVTQVFCWSSVSASSSALFSGFQCWSSL